MTHRYNNREGCDGTRLLTFIVLTAVLLGISKPTWADPFEMMVHQDDVYGAKEVESGDYGEAIRRLNRRLGNEGQSNSQRTPILIDLCVAYTMAGDKEGATKRCNQAVETGWYSGLAYNNRAVLRIAKGQYEAAVQDFRKAVEARGASDLARRNLERATTRLAEVQAQRAATRLAAASPQQEVSDR